MAKVTDVKRGEITEVTLVLTGEEARVLLDITHVIGGEPSGPRGEMNAIARALSAAGVPEVNYSRHGSIYFE